MVTVGVGVTLSCGVSGISAVTVTPFFLLHFSGTVGTQFCCHGYGVSYLKGAERCLTRALRVRGQRSGVRGQTHLGDAGLLLLELAEAEDPGSGLVAELLLERVEELHRLPEAGEHNNTTSSGGGPQRTSWKALYRGSRDTTAENPLAHGRPEPSRTSRSRTF